MHLKTAQSTGPVVQLPAVATLHLLWESPERMLAGRAYGIAFLPKAVPVAVPDSATRGTS